MLSGGEFLKDLLEVQMAEISPLLNMKSNLTSLEQDILSVLISKLDNDENNTVYPISIKEFKEITRRSDGNIYKNMVVAIKKMWAKQGHDINTDTTELSVLVISSVEHLKKTGMIEIEISKKIKPYLLMLKKYFYHSPMVLAHLFSIKGKYSKKLYEMCYILNTQYGLTSIELTIDKLKSLMGINLNSYRAFKDFEKRMLKEAVIDITGSSLDKTNMIFSYTKGNDNRKGVKFDTIILHFKVNNLMDTENISSENSVYILDKIDSLISWGIYEFTKEEQLYIYFSVANKKQLEFDNNLIIKHIGKIVNMFMKTSSKPSVSEFVDAI